MRCKKRYYKNILVLLLLLCLVIVNSACGVEKKSTTSKSNTTNQGPSLDESEEEIDLEGDAAKAEQQRFDAWCNEQVKETLEEGDTVTLHYLMKDASNYGVSEDKSKLNFGKLSTAYMKENVKENKDCKKELEAFHYNMLTEEQQLTYKILLYYLEEGIQGSGYELYNAGLSPDLGIPANIPVTLAEYPLFSKEDVETYLALLEKLPDYFAQLVAFDQEVADAGLFISDATLEASIKQMKDFIAQPETNFLITTFSERLDAIEGLTPDEKAELLAANEKTVKESVVGAYEQLIKQVSALKGTGKNPGGLSRFKKGKEYYEYLAKHYTCSDMSVKEIKKILQNRLKQLLKRSSEFNYNTFMEYDQIKYDFVDAQETIEYLKNQMADYFPDAPDISYEVKTVDESLADSLSPAFYMVPQIDNYKNNTIYINSKSKNFDADSLYATLAHEGFPGHMLQTTYFDAKNPHPIRQLMDFGGYSEGWATYVELSSYELYDYGVDDEDLTDFNQVEAELSLAISSLADIGVNYESWDQIELKEFLEKYNMGSDDIVKQVYDLVVQDPANYLQYYVSYLEFWNLRCRAKAQLGNRFDSKQFHTVILDAGPCPFPVLSELVDDYVKRGE